MADKTFSKLSDDVVLMIFFLLEDDPRNWARLCCVCKKFSTIIPDVCCKSKCISTLPSSLSADTGSHWSELYKVAVCCPGLLHSGVLLDNSDFGLLRELGPDENYYNTPTTITTTTTHDSSSSNRNLMPDPQSSEGQAFEGVTNGNTEFDTWTLYDDLYLDTVYDNSESTTPMDVAVTATSIGAATPVDNVASTGVAAEYNSDTNSGENKKRKLVGCTMTTSRLLRSHLASGAWNLSREQGNKLLASRFREDCLYISDWPGCIHMEEKRSYMVFRGVFRNFKRSRVWRTINDGNRGKMDLKCAFCECKEIWDLHSAFCLKRGFGFHDDGEPVVRAYVCENGHVSGAWTDFPLYA